MTSPTLALEKLMLTPGFDEAAAEWHAAVPTAQRDQADAAIDETRRVAHAIAPRIGAEASGITTAAQLPGWLRLALLDALARLMDGTADTCRHSPTPRSPQPVMAAAWRPGLVVCLACVHLLPQCRGSAADRTCDSCGRVCAGTPDDPIYPGLLAFSVVLFEYGTCRDCKPPEPLNCGGTPAVGPAASPTVGQAATVAPTTRTAAVDPEKVIRAKARGGRGRGRGKRAVPGGGNP